MGREGVRMIVVRKWMTAVLLLAVTVVILLITIELAGHTYTKVDPIPFHDLRILAKKMQHGPISFPLFVALIMPMLLNILLFLPWGFLMFLVLDKVDRPTNQSYLLTVLFALGLSFAVEMWQYFLPSRVTDINDIIFNSVGAAVGAVLGHLRKRVRLSFE